MSLPNRVCTRIGTGLRRQDQYFLPITLRGHGAIHLFFASDEDAVVAVCFQMTKRFMTYPANTYILRVRSPVLFPEKFYLDCFAKGIGGIIIMSCGEECPYEGAYHALATRIDRVYKMMKEKGLDIKRLRLTAICTVCTRAFVNEVNNMNQVLAELGPQGSGKAA